jgi:hypothetical protein
VAHVGVERLGTGDHQHDRSHGDERGDRVRHDERHGVGGGEATEHAEVREHLTEPGQPDAAEPQQHDGAEEPPDPRGPVPLHREQRDEDHHCDLERQVGQLRCGDVEPLHG